MIKLIIFDYDGVIVDSFPNVHDVYKIICKKLEKSCPENFEEFKKVYGHSANECYSRLGFSEDQKIKGNIIFKEEIVNKKPMPFENIIEVIKTLHENYKLAVISHNYREEVEQKLEKLGLLEFFNFILAKESHTKRVNKPEVIKQIMDNLEMKPNEVILIGDRNVDFIEGSKAGLNNIILVDYGWGYNLEEISEYKQKVLVKNPIDILEAIKEF